MSHSRRITADTRARRAIAKTSKAQRVRHELAIAEPPPAPEPVAAAELLANWIDAQRKTSPAPGARFSIVQLAKDLGVSKTAIHAWRSGLQRPSDDHAEALERLTKNAVPAVSWRVEATDV